MTVFTISVTLFKSHFWLVKGVLIDLVALATTINIDRLQFCLGGNGHSGLELDTKKESFKIFASKAKTPCRNKC